MALIAVLAITGVLWYLFLYLSFGGALMTPSAVMVSTDIDNGVKLTISSVSGHIHWWDAKIVLTDQTDMENWTPTDPGLTNLPGESGTITEGLGSNVLGSATIWCNVTDLDGNGIIDPGDFFTLTTSLSTFFFTTHCTAHLLYEPTGEYMCYVSFGG